MQFEASFWVFRQTNRFSSAETAKATEVVRRRQRMHIGHHRAALLPHDERIGKMPAYRTVCLSPTIEQAYDHCFRTRWHCCDHCVHVTYPLASRKNRLLVSRTFCTISPPLSFRGNASALWCHQHAELPSHPLPPQSAVWALCGSLPIGDKDRPRKLLHRRESVRKN